MASYPDTKDVEINTTETNKEQDIDSGVGSIVSHVRGSISGIVLLTGYSGAGKSTVAGYLAREYDARILQVGDALRTFLKRQGIDIKYRIDIWPTFLKKYSGDDVYEHVMKPLINDSGFYVVDCIRRMQMLKSHKADNPKSQLLLIETDDSLRFARLKERMFFKGEAHDNEMVRKKFDEMKENIDEVKALSDHMVNNNGTIINLQDEVDRFISSHFGSKV